MTAEQEIPKSHVPTAWNGGNKADQRRKIAELIEIPRSGK